MLILIIYIICMYNVLVYEVSKTKGLSPCFLDYIPHQEASSRWENIFFISQIKNAGFMTVERKKEIKDFCFLLAWKMEGRKVLDLGLLKECIFLSDSVVTINSVTHF